MSIYSAFEIGITTLRSQSNSIGIVSDNIANVSTVGYKAGRSNFSDLVQFDTSVIAYSPGGTNNAVRKLNSQQGDIGPGTATTDLAISGAGFFAVTANAQNGAAGDIFFTRAGAFRSDNNDNYRNGAGYYLQGWALDSNGDLPAAVAAASATGGGVEALQLVNIVQITNQPRATTVLNIKANLNSDQVAFTPLINYDPADNTKNMASGLVAPHFSRKVEVVDNTGDTHTLNLSFLKTANNTWQVEMHVSPASEITGNAVGQVAYGTMSFNGDGTLASISPALTGAVSIAWTGGATANSITTNWGTAGAIFGTPGATVIGLADGMRQTSHIYDVDYVRQDGVEAGTLIDVNVTEDGIVKARYTNGEIRSLYKIPLVDFAEANTLQSFSGNIFKETTLSGIPLYRQAGQAGVGKLQSNALEQSTAELETELTNLIAAQRAYQSGTKIISTTDAMFETAVNL